MEGREHRQWPGCDFSQWLPNSRPTRGEWDAVENEQRKSVRDIFKPSREEREIPQQSHREGVCSSQ